MGFTIPEIKTPVHPNAGNEIQSFVGMLNFISWGVSQKNNPNKLIESFWFKVMNVPIYSIQREVIKEFEFLKSQI